MDVSISYIHYPIEDIMSVAIHAWTEPNFIVYNTYDISALISQYEYISIMTYYSVKKIFSRKF